MTFSSIGAIAFVAWADYEGHGRAGNYSKLGIIAKSGWQKATRNGPPNQEWEERGRGAISAGLPRPCTRVWTHIERIQRSECTAFVQSRKVET